MSYAPIPMLPGPVSIPPEVSKALGQDYGSGQYEETFFQLYTATSENLAQIMGTDHPVVLMTGEGMLALWSALKSCLKAGDHVLSISTGVFGTGIGEMAASFGCIVKHISFPYDTTIDNLNIIEENIKQIKPVMITAVHCETPSGTLNPIAHLGTLKKDYNIPLLYIDAVSSIGGIPILMDKWHIDLLLGGSQKCLSAPPNMSIIGVSEQAWDYIQKINYQGYDALLPFKHIYQKMRCPYTPYWQGISALYAATQKLFKEGLQQVYLRHNNVAEQCRNGLKNLGIMLWPKEQAINSPTVTAAYIPQKFTWQKWKQQLAQHGLICGGSFGPMENKVFRLGHMGSQAQTYLMEQALNIIAKTL